MRCIEEDLYNPTNVGVKIKEAARKKNVTAYDIAAAIGVSHQAVKSWSCGRRVPNLAHAQKLCAFLDLTLDELVAA